MRWLTILVVRSGARREPVLARAGQAQDAARDARRRSATGSSTLTQEARDRGFSDALLEQTISRSRTAPARRRQRSLAGRAEPGLRPIPLDPADPADGSPRKGDVSRAPRRPRPGGAQVRRPAPFPAGALGHRDAIRPRHGQYAGLPGAGHARMGAAAGGLLPRRALQRADHGAARAHRGARP